MKKCSMRIARRFHKVFAFDLNFRGSGLLLKGDGPGFIFCCFCVNYHIVKIIIYALKMNSFENEYGFILVFFVIIKYN